MVHLGGTNADMDAIMSIARKHDIPVIEDCAQALGVAYNGRQNGTIGDIGVFSFTETKQITCGEGGMLITSNPTYAMKARLVRNHGEGVVGEDWPEEDLVNVVGLNFRLTEIQAAILQPQLGALDERNRIVNRTALT